MVSHKAFFIVPPTGLYYRDDRCQNAIEGVSNAVRPPMELAYMSAVLEKDGFPCQIKDYPVENSTWQELKNDIKSFSPTMLIVYSTTTTIKKDLQAFKIAKEIDSDIITIVKGGNVTALPVETMQLSEYIDLAIVGEPELTILEIAKNKNLKDVKGICYRENGKIHQNEKRPYITDLDVLPFPSRHLIDNSKYIRPDTGEPQTTIQASRGCPAKCIFCAAGMVDGYKVRLRSPQNIVGEIEQSVKKHNIRNFFFRADNLTWDKEWVINFCKEIIDKKLNINWVANSRVDTIDEERLLWMERAGCWLISYGIESGNQYILDKLEKEITPEQSKRAIQLTRQFKMKSATIFCFGAPWENKETLMETLRFTREIDPDFFEFVLAFPLPGTKYYEIAKRDGLILDGALDRYDHNKAFAKTYYLSAEEVEKIRKKSFWYLYARPGYIKKILSHCTSPKIFKNYCVYGFKKLKSYFA